MIAAVEFGFAFRDPAWLWLAPLPIVLLLWRLRGRVRVPFAAADLVDGGTAKRLALETLR